MSKWVAYDIDETKLSPGKVRLLNRAKIRVLPPLPPSSPQGGKRDLIWHHDWPLKKAIVCLQIKMKGNWKLTSCNSLSLLGAQKKDMVMGVGRVGAHSNWNRAVLLSLLQSASATKVFSSKVASSYL